uniref:CSON005960 protein n=1 Tax=Culicoides sonorensis TaxID=179676 RepID=A0A336L7X6_CULSO
MKTLLIIFFLNFTFVLIGAPDVEPPNTEVTSTTEDSTSIEELPIVTEIPLPTTTDSAFKCPDNCKCTKMNPRKHCCPLGFYFNEYWNMCLVGRGFPPRFVRDTKQSFNGVYRTCDKDFKFYNGKCVKIKKDLIISCKFPQKELPCCHNEFPKKCQENKWGDDCYTTSYYYCGEICTKRDNISEADLRNLIEQQLEEQNRSYMGYQSRYEDFYDPYSTCCGRY